MQAVVELRLLRTLYWLLIALLATLLGAIFLPVFWVLKKTGRTQLHRKLVYRYARWWGRVVLSATGSEIEIQGSDTIPVGPVVFMGNHLGIFDIMLLLGHVEKPLAFMAKKELIKVPIISSLMRHTGCLFLDRQGVRQAMQVFHLATAQIRNGLSMVIFPEGTRSQTGETADFKSGSMKLAIKADVPIVPFRIEGTSDILENNGYRIRPSQISLRLLPPIMTAEYAGMATSQVAKMVRQVVEESGNKDTEQPK